MFRCVIHASEQAVLDRHRPTATRLEAIRRREDVGDGKSFPHRQQPRARGVVGSMERHREVNVQASGRERIDTRHDADGGDGNLPPTQCAQ